MKQLWGCVLGFACLVGMAVAAAQSPDPLLTGTWIGGLESDGQFEFYAATVEGVGGSASTATVPMRGLSGPLRSLSLEGDRVRIAGPASLTLSGIVSGDVITGDFEAQGGRSRGRFRLSRIPTVKVDQLTRYQGAYRLPDGAMLLVDRAEIDAVTIPSALTVTDARTGSVRVVFLRSESTFVAGPSILVPEPPDFTLSFRVSGNRVTGLTQTPCIGTSAEAVRLETSEQEVRFRNSNVELVGTLLLPSATGRHPAVVFTHGGGPSVRTWHWGLAYLFASRGFAVLAYDKRGAGQSSGDWRDASYEDLADDAVAAAGFLRRRSDIDGRRIGFWGASQGAWIAPLSAVRFGAAAFVMTLSGGGLTPAQGELLDSEWELTKAGFSAADIREAVAFQEARNEFMRSRTGWEEYAALRGQATQSRALWYGYLATDLSGPRHG